MMVCDRCSGGCWACCRAGQPTKAVVRGSSQDGLVRGSSEHWFPNLALRLAIQIHWQSRRILYVCIVRKSPVRLSFKEIDSPRAVCDNRRGRTLSGCQKSAIARNYTSTRPPNVAQRTSKVHFSKASPNLQHICDCLRLFWSPRSLQLANLRLEATKALRILVAVLEAAIKSESFPTFVNAPRSAFASTSTSQSKLRTIYHIITSLCAKERSKLRL